MLGILSIMCKQLEISVMQGVARPLSKKKIVHAKDVHGKKGLVNVNLEYSPRLGGKERLFKFKMRQVVIMQHRELRPHSKFTERKEGW